MSKIIYLAGPYTHSNKHIKEARYEAITRAAAKLVVKGYIVYSPITMTHPIDVILAHEHATLGSDYWVSFDEAFMEHCSEMVVLTLSGWEQSSGIKREVKFFTDRKRPIKYVTMLDLV
jgi:hypothetical protein